MLGSSGHDRVIDEPFSANGYVDPLQKDPTNNGMKTEVATSVPNRKDRRVN